MFVLAKASCNKRPLRNEKKKREKKKGPGEFIHIQSRALLGEQRKHNGVARPGWKHSTGHRATGRHSVQSDPDVARCARINSVVPLTNPPVLQVGEKKQQVFCFVEICLVFFSSFFPPKQQHDPLALLGWGGGDTRAVIPEHGGGSGGGWGGDGRGSLMSL